MTGTMKRTAIALGALLFALGTADAVVKPRPKPDNAFIGTTATPKPQPYEFPPLSDDDHKEWALTFIWVSTGRTAYEIIRRRVSTQAECQAVATVLDDPYFGPYDVEQRTWSCDEVMLVYPAVNRRAKGPLQIESSKTCIAAANWRAKGHLLPRARP